MKNILIPILATVFFLILVGLMVKNSDKLKGLFDFSSVQKKEITINAKKILVEIAQTDSKRAKGLSDRDSLDQNEGLLFTFDNKNVRPAFWMKDMRFPIDIIWIKEGKITEIAKSVPVPKKGTADKNLTLYTPKEDIDYVFEVNAGFCDRENIKVGDTVDLSKAIPASK